MRHIKAVSMAVALFLIAASPVKADIGTILSGTYTGGNNFATTATFHVEYCFNELTCPVDPGVFYVGVWVTNEVGGGDGAVFKAIGLLNLPTGAVVDGTTGIYANDPAGWSPPPPNDLSGGGLPPDTWAWIAPNPAPTNGLQVGQSGVFYYRVSNVTLDDIMALGVGVHGVAGSAQCSTKMGATSDGVIDNAIPENYEVCIPVPEPASGLLLGTGLAGLFGVALFRRRED